ncbi:hypothetical protein LCGC14_1811850 [marine sediment metagenome]|uniref:Uncharacterized protein n=1 Tax=marine sediment metagenome TaxID=412755 RepID=A0A0F9JL57_9ZZZZ
MKDLRTTIIGLSAGLVQVVKVAFPKYESAADLIFAGLIGLLGWNSSQT